MYTRRLERGAGSAPKKLIRIRLIVAGIIILCAGLLIVQTLTLEHDTQTGGFLSLQMPFLYAMVPDLESGEGIPDANGRGNNNESMVPNVDIDDGVDQDIRFELLNAPEFNNMDLSGSEPKILIYHTHTTEAYTPTSKYQYKETTKWRTNDQTRSVVAVGDELARILREEYGYSVIHDTTDHEPPKLATSYSRSEQTMMRYREEYPSISLYIDLHRDAYNTKGDANNTDYAVIDGERVARLMFVVGTGEGATGQGFGEMPDFSSNYALAKRITDRLAGFNDRLVRNIRVKTGRYNQHISNQCLLVEVGHNANTLEEALASVKYLAAAIAESAGEKPDILTLTP